MPDVTNLAAKIFLNTKAAELEDKIPYITNLVAKAALDKKATETENKTLYTANFITTPGFTRFAK